jgi:hypothetical protein
MANDFIQLPLPGGGGNGTGAAVDVTGLSSLKSILVGGTFDAILQVETSSDGGTTFGPATVTFTGPTFKTLLLSATHLRLKVSGYHSGTPAVYAGSAEASTEGLTLDVPTTNGAGASSDISGMPALKTLVVANAFGGSLSVEISDDDTNWSPFAFFTNPGIFTQEVFAAFMRVVRANVGFDPGVPVVAVAAAGDAGAGAGGGFPAPYAREVVTVYARLTGDDDNGNGTLAAPYRTFERCLLAIPLSAVPGTRYAIDITGLGTIVLPDNYALPAFKSSFGREFFNLEDPLTFIMTGLVVRADPALVPMVPASDAVIELGDYTIASDPTTFLMTLTLTGAPRPAWAADALKGKFLIDSAGIAFGIAVIQESTDTTLVLSGEGFNFSDAPPLQIMETTATLECGDRGLNTSGADSIQFLGVKIENRDPTAACLVAQGNGYLGFSVCDLLGIVVNGYAGAIGVMNRCYWHDAYCDFNMSFDIFGCVLQDFPFFANTCSVSNYAAFEGCRLDNVPIENAAQISSYIPAAWMLLIDDVEIKNAPGIAVYLHGGGANIYSTTIKDSGGDAIKMDQGVGFLHIQDVDGSGNAGVGLNVQDGNQVKAEGTMALTGVGGDFVVGNQAPGSWAAGPQNVPDFAGAAATGSRLNQV